jgi:hypothetical protein
LQLAFEGELQMRLFQGREGHRRSSPDCVILVTAVIKMAGA